MSAEKDPVVGPDNRHFILALARVVGSRLDGYGGERLGSLVKIVGKGMVAKQAQGNSDGGRTGYKRNDISGPASTNTRAVAAGWMSS